MMVTPFSAVSFHRFTLIDTFAFWQPAKINLVFSPSFFLKINSSRVDTTLKKNYSRAGKEQME